MNQTPTEIVDDLFFHTEDLVAKDAQSWPAEERDQKLYNKVVDGMKRQGVSLHQMRWQTSLLFADQLAKERMSYSFDGLELQTRVGAIALFPFRSEGLKDFVLMSPPNLSTAELAIVHHLFFTGGVLDEQQRPLEKLFEPLVTKLYRLLEPILNALAPNETPLDVWPRWRVYAIDTAIYQRIVNEIKILVGALLFSGSNQSKISYDETLLAFQERRDNLLRELNCENVEALMELREDLIGGSE
jgi:hypothetical protein